MLSFNRFTNRGAADQPTWRQWRVAEHLRDLPTSDSEACARRVVGNLLSWQCRRCQRGVPEIHPISSEGITPVPVEFCAESKSN